MKEILLILGLTQINMLTWRIKADAELIQGMSKLHKQTLTHGRSAFSTYCQSPRQGFRVQIRQASRWKDACLSESLMAYRGARYWRLLVLYKYEILGAFEGYREFSWSFYR